MITWKKSIQLWIPITQECGFFVITNYSKNLKKKLYITVDKTMGCVVAKLFLSSSHLNRNAIFLTHLVPIKGRRVGVKKKSVLDLKDWCFSELWELCSLWEHIHSQICACAQEIERLKTFFFLFFYVWGAGRGLRSVVLRNSFRISSIIGELDTGWGFSSFASIGEL